MKLLRSILILSLFWLTPGMTKAQVFVNNAGTLFVGNQALFTSNTDVENSGTLVLEGELDINANFLNTNLFEAAAGFPSIFALNGNWQNDGTVTPGMSDVRLDGLAQTISGGNATSFFDLTLLGNGETKTLAQNITIENELDLGQAVLDVNDFTATLTNQNRPVAHTGGFVQTSFNGELVLQSSGNLGTSYVVPFGFGMPSPMIRNIGLQMPAAGNYSMALVPGDPTGNGMSSSSLQDSICRILDQYFWKVNVSQLVEIGFEKDASEFPFTRVSIWDGAQWTQVPSRTLSPPLPFDHSASDFQSGATEYVSLNTEAPFVDIEPDFEVFKKIKRDIKVDAFIPPGSDIVWTPMDQLSCGDCIPTQFIAKQSTVLNLTVTNDQCSVEDNVQITVLDQPDVFVQNAFSPTKDGLNETFVPILADYETLVNIKIFDRWGGKVYEGIEGWDGTYKSELVPQGMYMYEIEFTREYSPNDIRKQFSRGTVMVLR